MSFQESSMKQQYDFVKEKVKRDLAKYRSKYMTKGGVSMIFVLMTLAFTFIFLSSVYYKGWAFVVVSPAYYRGITIPSLKGKTAIITGYSSSSVSRATAFHLVRHGCHVRKNSDELHLYTPISDFYTNLSFCYRYNR